MNDREQRALLDENVVLVDVEDHEVGVASKLKAHQDGQLHRAFSVLVFDSSGSMLLQRRSALKYHSAGLWSNSCCGHPRPGEDLTQAAQRRLREELGLDVALHPEFSFIYEAALEGGMHEHELDHVFVGYSDADPVPDPGEVSEWRRVAPRELMREMSADPAAFTVWFDILMRRTEASRWQNRLTMP
ncbi:MAG: Isopentenyl-diphosphate delta-isomerase [Gemmatimonadetes bacterium]|nr:Isopentenyl-diphosphate delta-isomerase [Gemmatimonadota bacterium]